MWVVCLNFLLHFFLLKTLARFLSKSKINKIHEREMISDEEYLLLLEKKIETLSQRVTELEARFVEEDRTTPLWKLFTEEGECRDVLEKHVLTKLNDVDLKLFHFVNKESRAAIRRAKIKMSEKRFRVEEFSSVSTLEMAWERYPFMEKEIQGTAEPTQPHFCSRVARTNDLALLKWAREVKRCRWDWKTPSEAAKAGNLEMLQYCFEGYRNEGDFGPDPGRFWTAPAICVGAAKGGCLECLQFLHEEKHVPLNIHVCKQALKFNHMDCYQYARSKGCPDYNNGVYNEEDDSVNEDEEDYSDSEDEEEEEEEEEEEDMGWEAEGDM